jgi:ribosomal-protein-alanine N-acetyltransferase
LDPYIIFQTDRLTVRRYTELDQEIFHSLSGNEDVMRYIRPIQTRGESDNFLGENISFYDKHPQMGRWAVEEKTSVKFVGSFAIIFIPNSDKIQLGYSLKKEEWGKGYATELTRAGLHYVFQEMKLPLIYAVTEKDNIASQRVLLKAGFNEESRYMEENKELIRFLVKKTK